MGHVQDSPVSTKMILDECMIYHMKVHIVSYSLDPKKFSKSNIHISPKYERTERQVSVVMWLAPWPPVRETRVQIQEQHGNLVKFILVWVFFNPSGILTQP